MSVGSLEWHNSQFQRDLALIAVHQARESTMQKSINHRTYRGPTGKKTMLIDMKTVLLLAVDLTIVKATASQERAPHDFPVDYMTNITIYMSGSAPLPLSPYAIPFADLDTILLRNTAKSCGT